MIPSKDNYVDLGETKMSWLYIFEEFTTVEKIVEIDLNYFA